jgi:hypothetical protein
MQRIRRVRYNLLIRCRNWRRTDSDRKLEHHARQDCIYRTLLELSPITGKPIVARFYGGLLSSDGGLLALREIERRLGITARVAGCIADPRVPE